MIKRPNLAKRVLPAAITLGLLAPVGFIPIVHGQEADGQLEEIVITGARGRPRTVADSPVPIDVFNEDDLRSISYTDTNDILKTLVPSFTLGRQPISDGASFIRPAELRGLPTDKTLVLVNSKRRHRAALVSIGGSGTQGPDIATIPSIALANIEVLRDGASSQYGSDAIAGVLNFILKEDREGFSVSWDTGEYSEGDGTSNTVQANWGLPLGADGFINLSAEFYEADAAIRSEQYCESWACVDPNGDYPLSSYVTGSYQAGLANANIGDGDVVQPWGQPNQEAARFFYNSAYRIDADTEVYAFGNYSESESDGSFFYRYSGNGTIEDLREADGGIYSPLEKYPGGFTPRFFGEVYDFSFLGGVRGEWDNGLTYDLSARRGESEIEYTLKNTINPSMGRASPQSFRPGDLINEETQFQADFTYEFANSGDLASPLLLAFGASYMDESYEVVEGELDSYFAGPHSLSDPFGFCDGTMPTAAGAAVIANGSTLNCADPNDPAFTVVGVGSNGFPGYSPQFSEVYERSSFGLYADLSADVTDRMFLQGAVRYEDYDDFDSELVAKVAGRYSVNDNVGIRGSIGTGFRAPTPGQQGTINVSTRLPNGFPVATGLFPAGGPVAQALGASPLEPETSTNYTLGLTANIGDIDLTVDWYRIELDDATWAISTRDVSTDPTSGSAYDNFLKLDAAGVAGANSIGGVFYFANGFDISSEGVDLVASLPINSDNGTTTLSAALNYNKKDYESDPSAFRNEEARFDFVNYDPNWRGVFTATHEVNNLNLIARASYWGEWENANSGTSRRQKYDGMWYVDLEAQYQINDTWRISGGARNIFDEYPDKGEIGDTCCGRLYESGIAMDWHGAYYYGRVTVDF
ncbi:MAG: TonB-dependent receptor [Gammaproteobacteria bacterium]|nr:TonB-dependent receptor [Gammaproteobacteria bacterium]MDD9895466.1 TonB-dependent receptor [Gammaproteobacteria bacterium]MDD9957517.1 TonB-dependent receptor [Gammaproteobacteria bacterium]